MSRLLKALLNGATFAEALQASGQAIHAVAARRPASFKATCRKGYVTMPLYPELRFPAMRHAARLQPCQGPTTEAAVPGPLPPAR